MIRQIHPLLRIRLLQIRRSLLRARKTVIRRAKRRLPDLAELVQDVGHLGLVGVVVHEDDGAFLGQDQLRERGPVVEGHGDLGRGVGPFCEAGGFEGLGVVADTDEVGVADQDGDDVVGVGGDPAGDICEVFLGGASIEEVAGGVAVEDCVVDVVGLALQHADAIVELVGDAQGLVCGGVVGVDKRGVVGGDVGDVAVFAGAELGVVVASLGVCWGGGGGCCAGSGGIGGCGAVKRRGAGGALEERYRVGCGGW